MTVIGIQLVNTSQRAFFLAVRLANLTRQDAVSAFLKAKELDQEILYDCHVIKDGFDAYIEANLNSCFKHF